MSSNARPANRLARETSPYLLQHAHNPVDWFPWGEEAFAKARAEDKPILLSVGYATCHWCHVMERESFEDEAIARLMNAHFVPIKVDREELPDVDHVYMSALQAMIGQGGWPMNLFLTPQRAPFYGGTYFPPQARWGRASFADVLAGVHTAWTERRAEIEQSATDILAHLRRCSALAPRAAGHDVHVKATERLARNFDASHGGFGAAPRFPQAPLLQYLLTLAATSSQQARTMLVKTLDAMAAGGMYDHVGGGFARYSTDAHWHVPHFEKMLYDNAQLMRVYAGAYRLTGNARYRFVAEDIAAWLAREMHPAAAPAAFSCAQDADSEGEEGRFYVWTVPQLRETLGTDAEAAASLYGATADGNWERGVNVLCRRDPEAVRAALGLDPEKFAAWERSVRERLYAVRARRIAPITDDKVLADWNGMALRALAEAGRLLARSDYVQAAGATARFLLDTMHGDGQLRHAWRNGTLRRESFLSDHAQAGLGMLELHAATGEIEWLLAARTLCEQMIAHFHESGEGFFDSAAAELPVRSREVFDGALPSGTAAACELLLRLAGAFDRGDWIDVALQTLDRHGALFDAPSAAPALLHAQLLATRGADLALAAPAGELVTILGDHAPLATLVHAESDAVPLLRARPPGFAYLCRRGACDLPARTPAELRSQLAALHAGDPAAG